MKAHLLLSLETNIFFLTSYVRPLKFSIPLLFTTDVLTCALATGYLPLFYRTSPCAHCSYPEDDPCRSRNVGLLLLMLLYFLLHTFLELHKALRFQIDFTSMNFGDLLFDINCDWLKNEIRKIEKINKRIIQTKNGIYLNKISLKERLHPKFSNIYIYIYIYCNAKCVVF